MYINSLGHYLPAQLIPNSYFLEVNGLTDEWIYSRTGIKTRTKAEKHENTNTMAVEAVRCALDKLPYNIQDVDLIVGASYSPWDTVATIAHKVQHEFNINNAQAIYISSACSSFVNAVEIVEGYFAMGKATKALIITSEHNTAYSNESDEKSGHLWGDGAAAMFISKEPTKQSEGKVVDVFTRGLGNIGKGVEGVYLHPYSGGLNMPYGKDVFTNACKYMSDAINEVLNRNNKSISDVDFLIPHQANMRIIKYLASDLKVDKEKIITNIEELGNTGCASTLIGLSQNVARIKKGNLVGITVFGGGYSSGSMLIQF